MTTSFKFFFTDPMEMAEPVSGLENASRVFVSGTDLQNQLPGMSGSLPFETWGRVLARSLSAEAWCVYQKGKGFRRLVSFPVESDFGDGRDLVFLGGNIETRDLSKELDLLMMSDRRQLEPELISCLEHFSQIIFPVQATNGFDLEIFSVGGLKEEILKSLRNTEMPVTRRFVLNAHEARSEQKFHFDLWALGGGELPKWVEEV